MATVFRRLAPTEWARTWGTVVVADSAYFLIFRLTDFMDIADWRRKIDEIDQQLVEILNRRAEAAQEIGRLKRKSAMPIYEPDRERIVLEQVQQGNHGPLEHRHLIQIYERIMDVMRNIQKEEIVQRDRRE